MQDRRTILIIDDRAEERLALQELLRSSYEIVEAADGNEGLQIMEACCPQLAAVLLDLDMPGMDGFQLLRILWAKGWLRAIPLLLLADGDEETVLEQGAEWGAADVLTRPFRPKIVQRRVAHLVELYRHRHELESAIQEHAARLREQDDRQNKTGKSLLETLIAAIGFRNPNSSIHVRRMREITYILLSDVREHCPEYALTGEQVRLISDLSILHDIGKIGIPDDILNKRGPLTDEEYQCVQAHTVYGGELVERIDFQGGEAVRMYCYEICRHHHERWDGKGYPDGLKGDEIPIWVQAVAVADVYEALISQRVYKSAYGPQSAVDMILRGECGAFHPKILDALRRTAPKLTRELSGEPASPGELRTSFLQRERSSSRSVGLENFSIPEDAQLLFDLEQEKYRIIAQLSEDMIFTYNALTDAMEFSEKFCKVFQFPPYMTDYQKFLVPSRLFYPEEYKALQQKYTQLSWEHPEMEMDLRLPLPSGSRSWFHLVLHLLTDRTDRSRELGFVGKLTNINRIKKEATEWQKRANTDPLTQLCNRAGAHILFEELRQESRQTPMELTVAFLDIDHFKELNDTLGHGAGDQILTAFGQRVRHLFRPDDIVSRFGGDEFLVVMKKMGKRAFAETKLGQLCRQEVQIADMREPIQVSSSIGVAFFPRDGVEFDDLLRKADRALYASKRDGRGRVCFYEDLV